MRLRVSAVLNKIELELDRFFFFFLKGVWTLSQKKQEIPSPPHSWRLQVP